MGTVGLAAQINRHRETVTDRASAKDAKTIIHQDTPPDAFAYDRG